jgi:AcrR family transcriptional regulator
MTMELSHMNQEASPPTRRMGPPGSANWHAMLDGAEAILREEGYKGLTSRRVAERTGFNQRLVYYYFETMEVLAVETFRRLSARDLERLRQTRAGEQPLQVIWEITVQATDPRLISEFIALANRIESLREEVIGFIKESRAIQVDAITKALAHKGPGTTLSPVALAIVATSVALTLTREAQLGLNSGHAEVMDLIRDFIAKGDMVAMEQDDGGEVADEPPQDEHNDPALPEWQSRDGGLEVPEARRMKALEEENVRLKLLLASAMLDNAVLKEIARNDSLTANEGPAPIPEQLAVSDRPASGSARP